MRKRETERYCEKRNINVIIAERIPDTRAGRGNLPTFDGTTYDCNLKNYTSCVGCLANHGREKYFR